MITDITQLSCSFEPPEGSYVMVCRVRYHFVVSSYKVIGPWSALRLKIVGIQMTTDSCNISTSFCGAEKLLDGREDTHWFAYEVNTPQHWIRLEVKEGMSPVNSLGMKLVPNPIGMWQPHYKPSHVAVYGGSSFNSLTRLSDTNIGDKDDDVALLQSLDEVYRCFEIRLTTKHKVPAFMVCQLKARAREITATQILQ
ncbi:uncharacterized protein LOC144866713 [Branchiostoma floridae x Branchiostoma japonicum]